MIASKLKEERCCLPSSLIVIGIQPLNPIILNKKYILKFVVSGDKVFRAVI